MSTAFPGQFNILPEILIIYQLLLRKCPFLNFLPISCNELLNENFNEFAGLFENDVRFGLEVL